jgi:hypothetical protein
MTRPRKNSAKEETMASAQLQERREVRNVAAFPIEVSGIRDGEAFRERTLTQDVSEWGCRFMLSSELKREDIISIRLVSDDPGGARQSLYQVTRVRAEGSRWQVGAWKIGDEKMWSGVGSRGVGPRSSTRTSRPTTGGR